MELRGVYPIVPTPFDGDGNVDTGSLERLARFVVQCGAQGPAVLGVMGEAHMLNERERALVVETMRGALPTAAALVVGVRAAGIRLGIEAAHQANELGANAILLGPPPVQNDEAILNFYYNLAEAVDIPIIIHDYPASTGIVLSPPLISRIYQCHENIRYIKLEDPPTGIKMAQLQGALDDGLGVFGALGGMYAFEELDRGANGIMTGFPYPELLVEIFLRYQEGDMDAAATIFYDILPLIRFEFQPKLGVSLRKHILVQRGVFTTATVRQPATSTDPKTLEHLERILEHLRRRKYRV